MQNIENEVWKDIPNYEGIYQASSLGRVKSLSREIWRTRNNGYSVLKERILKNSINDMGYMMVGLSKDNKSKTRKTHQLVAEAFLNHKPCGYKLVINHKNFIKTDNRVENLEIVTARENCNHKHIKSSSKYTGVCWEKDTSKWTSQIHVNGVKKKLGRFKTEEEASLCYEMALIAIKNGMEIQNKPVSYSSNYRGVSWYKQTNRWRAKIVVDKIYINLGYFKNEIDAHHAYQKALNNLIK